MNCRVNIIGSLLFSTPTLVISYVNIVPGGILMQISTSPSVYFYVVLALFLFLSSKQA